MKKIQLILILFYLFPVASFASVVVHNGLTHIHNINGSKVQEGTIIVQNTGKSVERVKLYLNDILMTCDGDASYIKAGTNSNSLAPYLSIANQNFTLSAFERYEIVYQIDISNSDLLEASFWTLIMVDIEEPFATDDSNSGFQIGSKIRYAVQIIANIGLESPENIEFSDIELKQDSLLDTTIINVSLFNGGKYLVAPRLELNIYNAEGENVDNLLVNPRKLYPNNCRKFQIPLNNLPKGDYKGVLVAEYNDEAIGVNLEIKI